MAEPTPFDWTGQTQRLIQHQEKEPAPSPIEEEEEEELALSPVDVGVESTAPLAPTDVPASTERQARAEPVGRPKPTLKGVDLPKRIPGEKVGPISEGVEMPGGVSHPLWWSEGGAKRMAKSKDPTEKYLIAEQAQPGEQLMDPHELDLAAEPESLGTVFSILHSFGLPEAALWITAYRSEAFLPDPTVEGEERDIVSSTGDVAEWLTGKLVGSYLSSKFVEPELLEGEEDPFEQIGENLYSAVATGELLKKALERRVIMYSKMPFGVPFVDPIGDEGWNAPYPKGVDIINSAVPIEVAQKIAAVQPWVDPLSIAVDSVKNPFPGAGAGSVGGTISDKVMWEMLADPTGREALGVVLEVVFDPLWFLGPASAAAKVVGKGGKIYQISKPLVEMAGVVQRAVGKDKAFVLRAITDLIDGSPKDKMIAKEMLKIANEKAGINTAVATTRLKELSKGLKDPAKLAKTAKDEAARSGRKLESLMADYKVSGLSWKFKLAQKQHQELLKESARFGDDLKSAREYVKKQHTIASKEVRAYKQQQQRLYHGQSLLADGIKNGAVKKAGGKIAVHIPMGTKTYYPAAAATKAVKATTRVVSQVMPEPLIRTVGNVSDYLKPFNPGALNKKYRTTPEQLTRAEKVAATAMSYGTSAAAWPARTLDLLAEAFGTRYYEPLLGKYMAAAEIGQYATRRGMLGIPVLGDKYIFAKKMAPEAFQALQDALKAFHLATVSGEAKLTQRVDRWAGQAQKVLEERKAEAKANLTSVTSEYNRLDAAIKNATGSEKIRLQAEGKRVANKKQMYENWIDKEYTIFQIMKDSIHEYEAGARWARENPHLAQRPQGSVEKLVGEIARDFQVDLGDDANKVRQALFNLESKMIGSVEHHDAIKQSMRAVKEAHVARRADRPRFYDTVNALAKAFRTRIGVWRNLTQKIGAEDLAKALERTRLGIGDRGYSPIVHEEFIERVLMDVFQDAGVVDDVLSKVSIIMEESDRTAAVAMLAKKLSTATKLKKGEAAPSKILGDAIKQTLNEMLRHDELIHRASVGDFTKREETIVMTILLGEKFGNQLVKMRGSIDDGLLPHFTEWMQKGEIKDGWTIRFEQSLRDKGAHPSQRPVTDPGKPPPVFPSPGPLGKAAKAWKEARGLGELVLDLGRTGELAKARAVEAGVIKITKRGEISPASKELGKTGMLTRRIENLVGEAKSPEEAVAKARAALEDLLPSDEPYEIAIINEMAERIGRGVLKRVRARGGRANEVAATNSEISRLTSELKDSEDSLDWLKRLRLTVEEISAKDNMDPKLGVFNLTDGTTWTYDKILSATEDVTATISKAKAYLKDEKARLMRIKEPGPPTGAVDALPTPERLVIGAKAKALEYLKNQSDTIAAQLKRDKWAYDKDLRNAKKQMDASIKDLKKQLEKVKPRIKGGAGLRNLEPWEEETLRRFHQLPEVQNLSDDEVLYAAATALKEMPGLNTQTTKWIEAIEAAYPKAVGTRFMDETKDLEFVIDEVAELTRMYEKVYKEKGWDWIKSPENMLRDWGVLEYFPHIPDPNTDAALLRDPLSIRNRSEAYRSAEAGGAASMDNRWSMDIDATKKRQIVGTIKEINGRSADGTGISVDPLLIVSRYMQSNRAIAASEALYLLKRGGAIRAFKARPGPGGSIPEQAAEGDYVPLWVKPSASRDYELLMAGDKNSWESNLNAAGEPDPVTVKQVEEVIDRLKSWRTGKKKGEKVADISSVASLFGDTAEIRSIANVKERILSIRGRQFSDIKRGGLDPLIDPARMYEEVKVAAKHQQKITDAVHAASKKATRHAKANGFTTSERLSYIMKQTEEARVIEPWNIVAKEVNRTADNFGIVGTNVSGNGLAMTYGTAAEPGAWALYVPRGVQSALNKVLDLESIKPSGGVTKAFKKTIDKINNFWKTRVTIIAAAFHSRNFVANKLTEILDVGVFGALDPTTNFLASRMSHAVFFHEKYGSLAKAQRQLFAPKGDYESAASWAKRKAEIVSFLDVQKWVDDGVDLGDGIHRNMDEVLEEMLERGVTSGAGTQYVDMNRFESSLTDLMTNRLGGKGYIARQAASAAEDVLIFGGNMLISGGVPVALPKGAGKAVGRFVENQSRISNFLANFKRTGNFEEASEHAAKFLFDYGDLTAFQKIWMRTIFPFFTWNHKNVVLQLEMMQKSPVYYSMLNHAFIDGIPRALMSLEKDAPVHTPQTRQELRQKLSHVQSMIRVPLPEIEVLGVKIPKGVSVEGFGLPIEGFAEMMGLGSAVATRAGKLSVEPDPWGKYPAMRTVGMMHPLARFLIELVAKRHLHYDRPIPELTSGQQIGEVITAVRKIDPDVATALSEMTEFGYVPYTTYDGRIKHVPVVNGYANWIFGHLPWSRNVRDASAVSDSFAHSMAYSNEEAGLMEFRTLPKVVLILRAMMGIRVVQNSSEMEERVYKKRKAEVYDDHLEAKKYQKSSERTYPVK